MRVSSEEIWLARTRTEQKEREILTVAPLTKILPGVRGPVHGIDLGQVSAQGAPTAHMDPADGLDIGRGLLQTGVASGLAGILSDRKRKERKLVP